MYLDLIHSLPGVLGVSNFLAVIVGIIAGIVVGAMPGLSATMAISVLVPFTFGLDPLVALGLMAGIYNGAMYGGAIPAVLLRIPGTPAAVATTFDGYPMAQKGQGGVRASGGARVFLYRRYRQCVLADAACSTAFQSHPSFWALRSVLGRGLRAEQHHFPARRKYRQRADERLFRCACLGGRGRSDYRQRPFHFRSVGAS